MLGSSPLVDLLGMVAGHAYYFLEDVYPRMTGRRLLKTPAVVRALFPAQAIQAPRMAAAGGGGDRGFGGPAAGEQQQQQAAVAEGDGGDDRPHAD
jgi:Derlin-2/3